MGRDATATAAPGAVARALRLFGAIKTARSSFRAQRAGPVAGGRRAVSFEDRPPAQTLERGGLTRLNRSANPEAGCDASEASQNGTTDESDAARVWG